MPIKEVFRIIIFMNSVEIVSKINAILTLTLQRIFKNFIILLESEF